MRVIEAVRAEDYSLRSGDLLQAVHSYTSAALLFGVLFTASAIKGVVCAAQGGQDEEEPGGVPGAGRTEVPR